MAYWLLKTEPETFGYDDLVRVGREGWDGIRNYQARNFLREMRVGDQAIIYHSNAKPPGAAGVCEIVGGAEPDPTQFDPLSKYHDATSDPADPRWDWVTVAPVRKLRFIPLDALRTMPELAAHVCSPVATACPSIPLADHEFDRHRPRRGRRRPNQRRRRRGA